MRGLGLARSPPICYRSDGTGADPPMINSPSRALSLALLTVTLLALAAPASAADEDTPKGAAVTLLKAAKACFGNLVEVSGFILAREETAVRPERPGLK